MSQRAASLRAPSFFNTYCQQQGWSSQHNKHGASLCLIYQTSVSVKPETTQCAGTHKVTLLERLHSQWPTLGTRPPTTGSTKPLAIPRIGRAPALVYPPNQKALHWCTSLVIAQEPAARREENRPFLLVMLIVILAAPIFQLIKVFSLTLSICMNECALKQC